MKFTTHNAMKIRDRIATTALVYAKKERAKARGRARGNTTTTERGKARDIIIAPKDLTRDRPKDLTRDRKVITTVA